MWSHNRPCELFHKALQICPAPLHARKCDGVRIRTPEEPNHVDCKEKRPIAVTRTIGRGQPAHSVRGRRAADPGWLAHSA